MAWSRTLSQRHNKDVESLKDKNDASITAIEEEDIADKIGDDVADTFSPIGGPFYTSYTNTYAANYPNKLSARNA